MEKMSFELKNHRAKFKLFAKTDFACLKISSNYSSTNERR